MKTRIRPLFAAALLINLTVDVSTSFAQGTAFTYQGRLNDGTNPASGIYDLRFAIFDLSSGGAQQGLAVTNTALGVSNGLFTVTLDFGDPFSGAELWLEIGVRTNGGGAFTPLTSRQKITPTPYAITAGNFVGTLPSSQLTGTYGNAVTLNNASNSLAGTFIGNGTGLTNVNALTLGGFSSSGFWRSTGNAGTTPGTHFLGTTDNQALEIKINNQRALRIEPTTSSPNLIGGDSNNLIASGGQFGSVIAGGSQNSVRLFGGLQTSPFSVISGGRSNLIEGSADSVIGGGLKHKISQGGSGTISGGQLNTIGSTFGTIGGGNGNTVGLVCSSGTIGGGNRNTIEFGSPSSTISGGNANVILGFSLSTISGGVSNSISGSGTGATVPGGELNEANGDYSFAAGRRAKANHTGTFVWADSADADHASTATNQFLIRASGGVGINVTNPADVLHVQSETGLRARTTTTGTGFAGFLSENSLGEWFAGVASATNHWYVFENAPVSGARLVVKSGGNVGIGTTSPTNKLHVMGGATFSSGAGGANQTVVWAPGSASWSFTSDRHAKEDITLVDPNIVLDKLTRVPVAEWNYIGYPQRHIGPMAQDFHAQFPLSADDKMLNDADLHGVALAAIQGLNQKVDSRSQKSDGRIQKLETENAELKARLEKLEQLLNHKLNGDAQ